MTDIPKPGTRVRVTIEETVDRAGPRWFSLANGSTIFPDRDAVTVEVLPGYQDGDVVQSANHPENVAVRRDGRWHWTGEPALTGWDDDITAGHLASGYYRAIRVAGKAPA